MKLRQSPYKNVFWTAPKPNNTYDALDVADARAEGRNLACSSQFLAYADSSGGGNALAVLPLSSLGRNHVPVTATAYKQPLCRGHTGMINAVDFDPFDPSVVASGAEDGTARVWAMPSAAGMDNDVQKANATLKSPDEQAVRNVAFNPVASGVLATGSKTGVAVWDVRGGGDAPTAVLPALETDNLQAMCWDRTGARIVVTAKSKVNLGGVDLHLLDPRSGAVAGTVLEALGHNRGSDVRWAGHRAEQFITAGYVEESLKYSV